MRLPGTRIARHSRRTDRQRRAKELQERMAADSRSVAQREHDRGHHKKCDHAAEGFLREIFEESQQVEDIPDPEYPFR